MKCKIILFVLLALIMSKESLASEYIGFISTEPKELSTIDISEQSSSQTSHKQDKTSANGSVIIQPQSGKSEFGNKKDPNTEAISVKEPIKVLGAKSLANGSLIRGVDKKVYIIQGMVKKHIISLAALLKYQGKAIYKVDESVLSQYRTQLFLDGELIRYRGSAKVYAIKYGQKIHIINLAVLRSGYVGLAINNI